MVGYRTVRKEGVRSIAHDLGTVFEINEKSKLFHVSKHGR